MSTKCASDNLRFLREPDPGLLRLTQACKTLVAVMIELTLFWHAAYQTRLFAAAGAAYIMQCSSIGPMRRRQWTMLITGIAMAAAVGLGGALKGHNLSQDLLLIFLAALAYYSRRLLPDKNQFPIFGFVLCVLATVLSTGPKQAVHDMAAVATAIPLSFVIYFYVLRPKCIPAARDELRDFCLETSEFLERPWDRRRLERLVGRPAMLKSIADNQPDDPAAPKIREAARDQNVLLESLLVICRENPTFGFPVAPALPTDSITFEKMNLRADAAQQETLLRPDQIDALLALPPRDAAHVLAVLSALSCVHDEQERLADAAAALASAPGGTAS